MSVSLPPPPPRAERAAEALATDHLMADLGRRTVSGGAIAVGAQVVKLALQLVTLAILARLLAPGDFGLVAMAATVTAFVGMFTDLGLSAATVQRKEIDQDTVSALFLVNLAMGVLVMVAVIALAPLAAWFFDDPRVRWVVTALALPIPLLAASRQHAALLQRGMRFVAIEWTAIAAQAVAGIAAIVIAWRTDLGYWALVAQGWIGAVLTLALLWAVCPWRPSRVRDWRGARSALGFGLHLTGFNFLNYFNRQFDNVLIGGRWGADELGYYTRAYALLMLPLSVINGPVGSAVIPALSRMQGDPERWRKAYLEALGAVTLVSSGITAVLITTAEPLVALLYGPGWEETGRMFSYLAISMFAATPSSTVGWIYISRGRMRRMMTWGLIATPLLILSFLLGLPYGAAGVALSYSLMMCVLTVPCLAFALRGLNVRLSEVLRIVALPAIGAAALALIGGLILHEPGGSHASVTAVVATTTFVSSCYTVWVIAILYFEPALFSLQSKLVSAALQILRHQKRTR